MHFDQFGTISRGSDVHIVLVHLEHYVSVTPLITLFDPQWANILPKCYPPTVRRDFLKLVISSAAFERGEASYPPSQDQTREC